MARKKGKLTGLCPFHNEKTPSFTVSPSKKIFKCFGCGKSGNSISFISEFKKISHDKAIEDIATTFHISIPTSAIDAKDLYDEESIISKVTKPILDSFLSHIESVKSLMSFDKILLDFCITQIEGLNNRIKVNKEINITNVRFLPEATLIQLRTIRQNDSLRIQYESIYNQCIVLIVSYFTSSVRDLFRDSIKYYAEKKHECLKSINAELKFTFEELESYNFDLSESIGEIIIKKKNLTFQDMQSICREFQTYFGFKIEKDSVVDNVILAQASRHAIVHSLSIADEKFINQISQTPARTIKPSISLNDELKFSPIEIEELMKNMREFLSNIEQMLIIR
ncbi:MAG: CHC2 zinc finger domain-containing protein [Bacteroidales bacterium]|jgi:hypothetical protein|nr:CHC2 zinc finger domain-containing protein [Bacteroidales bacterium]